MGIDLSHNCEMIKILTHVDITFFSQNKPVNNCLKYGKHFMGHSVFWKLKYQYFFMEYICLLHEGSRLLQNDGEHLQDCTVLQPIMFHEYLTVV
jgi:hypothetical protein